MLIRLYNDNLNPKHLQKIVDILQGGGVIIYPTDTIYGIACCLSEQKAMQRIAKIKGRHNATSFSLICKDIAQASQYCKPISNDIFKEMKSVLPGPYAFILEVNNQVPKLFCHNKRNIGIRIPNNLICMAIVEKLGLPLVSTSIEIDENEPEYSTDPGLIYEKYENIVDMVIDGGYGSIEDSTIIDCSNSKPIITT
ncbi:MAG: threonylcarbamoyl-AMP synthase [Bacteroidales bacterium]|jgi:tRNA threonylcarbamoyl adenosine modification protein (Sua5/YciO/YrdC/YwlC family)|nr:threonylcarbamoyl-AMP synthase [Bacteroidales bacterium]